MTTTEQPKPPDTPGRDSAPRRSDKIMTKIGILIVAALAVTALVVSFVSGSGSPTSASGSGPGMASSAPIKVTVPSINATSSIIPLGQEKDGSLSVPPLSQPMQAAWYDKSPTPGAVGPAVILGHVNGNGKPGIFLKLDQVQKGQQVFVDRADGQTAVFTVDHVDLVPKDAFPTMQVYGDTQNPQLRLITCGGELDRAAHSYKSNVVVYADLTDVRKT